MACIVLNYKKSDSCKKISNKTLQKVAFFYSVTQCGLVKFMVILKERTAPVLKVEGRRYFRKISVVFSPLSDFITQNRHSHSRDS
jgi:hypothetical protein